MKLRNKKTRDIIDVCIIVNHKEYRSISELYEDYDDIEYYTPKEPLIKDEKIRKTVRAWAEMLNFKDEMRYMKLHGVNGNFIGCHQFSIDVPNIEGLQEYNYYTLAELCGEEE